jgi:hypothetical protein
MGGNGTCPGYVTQAQLLKQQKSCLFADEPVKTKFAQAHSGGGQWC